LRRNKNAKSNYSIRNIDLPVLYTKIENRVKFMDGVEEESLKVSYNSSKVKFNFDEETVSIKDIEDAISKLGFEVKKSQVKAL